VAILENGERRCTITFKGKLQPGSTLKTREEIEFKVDGAESADELFQRLGYSAMLAFEKRRETWNFADCEIALDQMPYLGTYVEIEGPSDEAVFAARKSLNLADLPLISRGYISLLAEYLFEHKINERHVRL
jgi:adenylate cyclase, class 2